MYIEAEIWTPFFPQEKRHFRDFGDA